MSAKILFKPCVAEKNLFSHGLNAKFQPFGRYSKESSFACTVFGDAAGPSTVLQLYTDILKNLPIKESLKNITDEIDADEILINLASLRLSAENFVSTIKHQMEDAGLTIRDIEKFVQAVWAPFGNSVVKFKDLIAQSMKAKVSQFRIDGDRVVNTECFQ